MTTNYLRGKMILHICKDSHHVRFRSLAFYDSDINNTQINHTMREVTDGATGEVHRFISVSPEGFNILRGLDLAAVVIEFEPVSTFEKDFVQTALRRVK